MLLPEPYRDAPFAPLPEGTARVGIRVGERLLVLEDFPTLAQPFLDEHYPGFHELDPDGEPGLTLRCRVVPGEPRVPLPGPGDPPVVDVDSLPDESIHGRSHWHEARIDFSSGEGDVEFTDMRYLNFRMSLENCLRVAFAGLLIRDDACLLHAAGIVKEGKAHVFFGLSGSGKSRLADLSRPLPILSDDLVSLSLKAGRLRAERVPFYGEHPSTEREGGVYDVASLSHIAPSPAHALNPLPRSLQVARLRSCLPFLAPGEQRSLELSKRVAQAMPIRSLEFADDAGFWELLD